MLTTASASSSSAERIKSPSCLIRRLLRLAPSQGKKRSDDAERRNEQHQLDQDQNCPARADVVFCYFGIEADKERHVEHTRRERPAACQHGYALPADGLAASLIEACKQPGDAEVINNPQRRELPMAPIDHGFADSQPHGEEQGGVAAPLQWHGCPQVLNDL